MFPSTIKEYIYAALVVALGIAVWRIYADGEARISSKDQEIAAMQRVHNEEVESRADIKTQQALQAFKTTLNAPITNAPSIVCKSAKTSPSSVPSDQHSSGNDEIAKDGTDGEKSFDPAPAVIEAAMYADAQITLMQESLKRCIEAKMCKVVN